MAPNMGLGKDDVEVTCTGRADSESSQGRQVTAVGTVVDPKSANDHKTVEELATIEERATIEDPTAIKKTVRKVDRHLIGVMGFVIVIEFLDRVGLGFAKIAGVDKELHLDVGFRFSLLVLVGSIAAACAQIPMMAYADRVRPPIFIGTACCVWAAMYIGQGLATKWWHLIPYRIIAGASHGGLNQVSNLLIQTWYARYDLCRRLAWISVITWLSKAAGGAAATGITKLDGLAGLSGWRWIFIFAGSLTFIAGVLSFCGIVGYADKPQWRPLCGSYLSIEEMHSITQHLERDRKDSDRKTCSAKDVFSNAWDFKFWLFGLIMMSTVSILTSLGVFTPMIVHHELGFNQEQAQGLYAPPYVFAAIMLIVVSEISDRTQNRSVPILVCTIIGMIGLIILGFTKPIGLRYFGIFLANGGLAAITPLTASYLSNNVRGFHKRTFGVGLSIAFAGLGGVIGACVFRSQDKPKYIPGLSVSVALCLLICAMIGILSLHFHRENRKQLNGKVLEGDENWRHTY